MASSKQCVKLDLLRLGAEAKVRDHLKLYINEHSFCCFEIIAILLEDQRILDGLIFSQYFLQTTGTGSWGREASPGRASPVSC